MNKSQKKSKTNPKEHNEIWDRLPKESAKAFAAFQLYRNQGYNRSISKVSIQKRKSRSLIQRWSKTHNWVERAQAWDQFLDKYNQDNIKDELEKMNHRQLKTSILIHEIAKKRLTSIQNPQKQLTITNAIRLLDLADKIERSARVTTTNQEKTTFVLRGFNFKDRGNLDKEY